MYSSLAFLCASKIPPSTTVYAFWILYSLCNELDRYLKHIFICDLWWRICKDLFLSLFSWTQIWNIPFGITGMNIHMPAFVEQTQVDPCIKDQLKITLLPTMLPLWSHVSKSHNNSSKIVDWKARWSFCHGWSSSSLTKVEHHEWIYWNWYNMIMMLVNVFYHSFICSYQQIKKK